VLSKKDWPGLKKQALRNSPACYTRFGKYGGFSFILEQKQAGGDVKNFEKVLQTFVADLNKRPEIGKAFSFFTARTPAYQLTIDREKAKGLVSRYRISIWHCKPTWAATL